MMRLYNAAINVYSMVRNIETDNITTSPYHHIVTS